MSGTRLRVRLVEQWRRGVGVLGGRQTAVRPCRGGRHPTPRRALEHAELKQERLVDVFEGVRLFADADGERRQTDRAAAEAATYGVEDGAVEFVEALLIHAEESEALVGCLLGDDAVAPNLGVVADPAQEAVGDSRCTAGPAGDLGRALLIELHAEDV